MHLERHIRLIATFFALIMMVLSIIIWAKTPDLFQYFNQAFCPH